MGRFHIAASIALAMGRVQRVPAGALTSGYWITLGLRGKYHGRDAFYSLAES